jgi:hypothetical protein
MLRFGEPFTPALVLSLEIVRNMHWQGRLSVVYVIEADYLTNCPKLFLASQF